MEGERPRKLTFVAIVQLVNGRTMIQIYGCLTQTHPFGNIAHVNTRMCTHTITQFKKT